MRRTISCLGVVLALLAVACERAPDEQTLRELITARTLGLGYLEENQLDEAEAQFRRVIDLEPDEALGYANLGILYMLVDDRETAEEYVTRALEITPDDPDARYLLAQIYLHTDREPEARAELERTLERSPEHVRTLYALAELAARSDAPEARQRRERYLATIVDAAPSNLLVRLQLLELLLQDGKADEAARQLEEIGRIFPALPAGAQQPYEEALRLTLDGRAADAIEPAAAFHAAMRQTTEYGISVPDLVWQGLQRTGFPTFSSGFTLEAKDELARAQLASIRFTDASSAAGLEAVWTSDETTSLLAAGDYDGDGDVDLFVSGGPANEEERTGRLLQNESGRFTAAAEPSFAADGRDVAAAFGDYDNDGWLDLYVVRAGTDHLYRNEGEGLFTDVSATAGVGEQSNGRSAVFLDADHDGDLDIYVLNEGLNRLYRNNLDGTFVERAEEMGLAGGEVDSRRAAFGDWDGDGDLDLFVANADAPSVLYDNLRQGRFENVGAASGIDRVEAAVVAAGDYDNDGLMDLFLTGPEVGRHRFYRNRGDGTFEPDGRFAELERVLQGSAGLDASFLDFDNDGWLDLVVAGATSAGTPDRTTEQAEGTGGGLFLFHNDAGRRFEDFSSALPPGLAGIERVIVADYDNDGDLDLFVSGAGAIRLLRNDGGNANHYLDVQLVGLRAGSGKANHFGIGSRVEVRAGELLQARTVTEPTTHIGLGSRPQADAVRVVWTNGVPQTLFQPQSDQTLVQRQVLKGSCPFLYAWDGDRFSMVTDVMWRSALGMPLGIMGADRAYAPAAASREYVRIPGAALAESSGEYVLQLTEELWEIVYVDELRLVAVDHPDSIEVFVNEAFVPPGPAVLTLHQVARARPPVAAADGDGNELLPQLREQDDVYVSNLMPGRYQGIVEPHDLILDLGPFAAGDSVTLFLTGWILPTDASINVAMSQSRQDSAVAPYLEVIGAHGGWVRAIDDLGFPSGKRKTVIADLSGRFPTPDHRVRIRTNMQIYWDRAFFSLGSPHAEPRTTFLDPRSADLHFRGFSREYRKGGRYGPYWFDYEDVSTAPRWLPLEGAFTRFGDARPLLLESDDEYVVMAPGDEITIRFEADRVPPLPPGWTRDFLLYSVGWVKDADLNTATGNTVAPLPFHDMSRYPYGPDETYPEDEAHRSFLEQYLTRRFEAEGR